jgi:sugar phosphate isomerase/epimerase
MLRKDREATTVPGTGETAMTSRREFVKQVGAGFLGSAMIHRSVPGCAAQASGRKMTIHLVCGAIGVRANQTEAIDLAHRFGFESVEARDDYLAGLSDGQVQELLADMKKKNLVWGSAGLALDFRQDESKFLQGMKDLPRRAAGLQRAGVKRVGTWLMPCDDRLTYLQNFKSHATRLREACKVLKDHGLSLGMEYVGTQSLRNSRRYPFVHTMAETSELIAEIGTGNVGFVLDSWHWWTAGETAADILALTNHQVVAVDLNDAPAGIPREQQNDTSRELPAATGVIEVASFLKALVQIGYDGPVRAEPFNKTLNELDNEPACKAVIEAMKKAFAQLETKA